MATAGNCVKQITEPLKKTNKPRQLLAPSLLGAAAELPLGLVVGGGVQTHQPPCLEREGPNSPFLSGVNFPVEIKGEKNKFYTDFSRLSGSQGVLRNPCL